MLQREAQATVTHGKANHNFDRTLAEAREDGEAVLSTTKEKLSISGCQDDGFQRKDLSAQAGAQGSN